MVVRPSMWTSISGWTTIPRGRKLDHVPNEHNQVRRVHPNLRSSTSCSTSGPDGPASSGKGPSSWAQKSSHEEKHVETSEFRTGDTRVDIRIKHGASLRSSTVPPTICHAGSVFSPNTSKHILKPKHRSTAPRYFGSVQYGLTAFSVRLSRLVVRLVAGHVCQKGNTPAGEDKHPFAHSIYPISMQIHPCDPYHHQARWCIALTLGAVDSAFHDGCPGRGAGSRAERRPDSHLLFPDILEGRLKGDALTRHGDHQTGMVRVRSM